MWPAIAPGTRVVFVPCRADNLRPGDIVLADLGVALTSHRALRRDGGGWWIRDDYWGEVIGGLSLVRGETSFALQFETSVGREELYEDRYMARYAHRF